MAVVGLLTSGSSVSQAATPPTTVPATTATTATTTAPVAKVALKSATSASSTITYHLPPSSYIAPGQTLFELNCSSCHGVDASGTARAPNLQGLGPSTVDFWVSTGRMPLAVATAQPVQKPPRFDPQADAADRGVRELPGTDRARLPLGHPHRQPRRRQPRRGQLPLRPELRRVATPSPAPVTRSSNGFLAPSLHKIYACQIAEAIRTGPTQMPHFGPGNLTDQQVTDIVKYVTSVIQHPANQGGLGLGGIGPVAEGFIGLLFGVGGIMLVAFWLGDRK